MYIREIYSPEHRDREWFCPGRAEYSPLESVALR